MANSDSDLPSRAGIAHDLRRFLGDFIAYAGRKSIVAAAFVVLGALLEGLGLVLLVPLLGIVIGPGAPSGRLASSMAEVSGLFGIESRFGQLTLMLILFGVLMIVRAGVLYVRDINVIELQTGFVEGQRLRIAESLAAARWDQVAGLRHARITQLMSGDIQRIGTAAFVMLRCAVAVAMLVVQGVLVFMLAPLLALLTFGCLAVGAIVFVPVIRRSHELGTLMTDANLSLLNSTAQFLGGLKLAISQNLQVNFITEFRQNLHMQTARQIEHVRQQTNRSLVMSTLSAFAAGLLVLIGFGVLEIAPATLITLLLIIARMSGPAGQIQLGIQQLAQMLPVYDRVKTLESELAVLPHERQPAAAALLNEGPIVFDDVWFVHAADDGDAGSVRGVQGVSITIMPGEFIGISGPSGAGKTTLADLLVGLYPPGRGRITIAGVTLDRATVSSWRNSVSYVSQDPFLFHDTVRHNLNWADAKASETEMWHALDLAGAGGLVRHMERGLDTVVGERGTLVSGGERQRIALARAILRKPRLMVLDEATSAIDVAGERDILARLRAFEPRPTVVIIAHRAESLSLCDRVYRLEAGRCADDRAAARD